MNHRIIWIAALALLVGTGSLWAQTAAPAAQPASESPVAKQPVPKSAEEVAALQAMLSAPDPDSRIKAANELLEKFKDTEFKGVALSFLTASYQQKNDYEKTLAYGERALQADPDNFNIMLMLARLIASRTREFDLDREEKLALAEKYANRVIEGLKTAPRPNPSVTDEQWVEFRKDLTAEAYEALGMAAFARGDMDAAIQQFNNAIAATPFPDPATLVRLGSAYNKAGRFDEAIATFDKVIALEKVDPQVKQIAQAERARAVQSKANAKP